MCTHSLCMKILNRKVSKHAQKAFVCYKQYNTHKLLHIVTTFLTQSFSAASAVQTDSSLGSR